MKFSLDHSIKILENTPMVVYILLNHLSGEWINNNEGENTWTAKEVVSHLIVCEETNWLPRAKIILSDRLDRTFIPIDMTTHLDRAKTNSLEYLIEQFKHLRENGINELKSFQLQEKDLKKTADHPKVGQVNLQQLIATWVTHDLTHIAQISRILAKQNKELVGPFVEFLNILKT